VQIDNTAIIINPENVEIGNNVRIDAFTKIIGGNGVKLGDYVHISSFSCIMGGGECIIGDFGGISCGCIIITGSDDYLGAGMTNPTIPKKFRAGMKISKVVMGKHTVLGTNTIVHPGVTIGEGVATGSLTLVTKDLEPWTIYLGAPARKYKNRPKENILKMEKELLKNTANYLEKC
jgi:acetyltransferase-like isoleucine patch superfamily enzyme